MRRHLIKELTEMSFFGSLFGELVPGLDCSSVEQDPHADPFDKEVCQHFRRFNDAFGRGFNIEHRSPDEESVSDKKHDPQSLRDAILNRPEDKGEQVPNRWPSLRRQPQVDEDLDERVQRDPSLLDEYLAPQDTPSQPKLRSHSSFSSVVITTRPDGTIEKRTTVRDSDGKEEVTVTYSGGGQTHTEEHRTNNKDWAKSLWDRLGL